MKHAEVVRVSKAGCLRAASSGGHGGRMRTAEWTPMIAEHGLRPMRRRRVHPSATSCSRIVAEMDRHTPVLVIEDRNEFKTRTERFEIRPQRRNADVVKSVRAWRSRPGSRRDDRRVQPG